MRGGEVLVLAVQTEGIPDEIRPGLSGPVSAAVPVACRWLLGRIKELS